MIELKDLVKKFGAATAINSISLTVKKGEFLTLLGPSGCGKTTTLRMIAGFEEPTEGDIFIEGKPSGNLPPNKRNVNTVFQNYALFPHLSIRDNIAFGLKLKREPRALIKEKVERGIRLVKLEEHVNKRPEQLSGGQKQRVAIARAIVNEPRVLLLDEPLGALDLKLRKEMQLELKHLQRQLGITFIYVTHDQEEALTMSDRIVVMNKGNIEQIGTAKEIYEYPGTRFVADFIGEANLITAELISQREDVCEFLVEGQRLEGITKNRYVKGTDLYLSIRPENIHFVDRISERGSHNFMKVIYKEPVYVGNVVKHITFTREGLKIVITRFTRSDESYREGDEVIISWRKTRAVVIHR